MRKATAELRTKASKSDGERDSREDLPAQRHFVTRGKQGPLLSEAQQLAWAAFGAIAADGRDYEEKMQCNAMQCNAMQRNATPQPQPL